MREPSERRLGLDLGLDLTCRDLAAVSANAAMRAARSNRRARAASPPSSMRALSPRGRPRGPPRRHRAGRKRQRRTALRRWRRSWPAARSPCAGRTTRPTVTAVNPPSCSVAPRNPGAGRLLAQGEALVSGHRDRQGLRRRSDGRRGRRPGGQTGNLGRSRGHKKRGKSGRYFGRDRAVYGGRGQGFVGPAGRGNDLPEFRTELDTGLCCDYFKAHAAGVRGCRIVPKSLENGGFGSGLGRGAWRAANRSAPCGAD